MCLLGVAGYQNGQWLDGSEASAMGVRGVRGTPWIEGYRTLHFETGESGPDAAALAPPCPGKRSDSSGFRLGSPAG